MSDLNFEKLLGEHSAAFSEAEAFDDWMPPEGEYITLVGKVKRGSYTKESIEVPFWRICGQIQDPAMPEIDQKEYSLGYFTPSSFRGMKTFINAVTGEQINGLAEADKALDSIEGLMIKTHVVETYSEKHKRYFVNVKVLDVLPTYADPVAEAPTPPEEAEVATE